jgi:hypothetical protein
MAIPGMTTGYKDTVCPSEKGPDDKERIDPAGTGDADDAKVRGLSETAYTCRVGAAVRTPVTEKTDDAKFFRRYI